LGIQQVWLEGDAKIIVDALNSNTNKWSRFGHILDDTRCMMLSFQDGNALLLNREANEAAHRLAKEASSVPNMY
jgi:hypothetical protein